MTLEEITPEFETVRWTPRHEYAEDFGKSAPSMRTPALLMISKSGSII